MQFLKLSRRFIRVLRLQNAQQIVRPLFTAETLDLLTYQSNRQDARNNVESPHRFKWELQCYIENEKDKEATSLKNAIEVLVHLAQSDTDDVKLIKNTLYAYGSTEGVTDKAKRAIGNLVMKAIYSINMPNVASELYTDPKLSSFFAGFKSTLIFFDLLYVSGMYDKIIDIDSKKRQEFWSNRTNFTKFIDVLVFGACYKLNTPASLDYALKLWSTVGDAPQFQRSAVFVAALALNQGQPVIACQSLKNIEEYFVSEQIKLLALADLGYVNEVIEALSLWKSHKKLSKHKLSKDVSDRIRERLEQNSTVNSLQQFDVIHGDFVNSDRISNESLDDLLDRPLSQRIQLRGKRAGSQNDQGELENFISDTK